jgi:hypothetical protein
MPSELLFSEEIICPYCNNVAPMKEISSTTIKSKTENHGELYMPEVTLSKYWQILECPACRKNILREGWYNDFFVEDGINYKVIYPLSFNKEYTLPGKIKTAYTAAQKVKHIDSNAFAVLLGRLLDLICEDKNAQGNTLYERIRYLSINNIIPDQVTELALGLKNFRNIGAHANLGNLSENEIPIIEDITEIILDYIYKTPMLIEKVKMQISILKGESQT